MPAPAILVTLDLVWLCRSTGRARRARARAHLLASLPCRRRARRARACLLASSLARCCDARRSSALATDLHHYAVGALEHVPVKHQCQNHARQARAAVGLMQQ